MDHYTTKDEIHFLLRIFHIDRPAFVNYAEIVLSGRRRWDRHIEVEQVESKIRELQIQAEREADNRKRKVQAQSEAA